DRPAARGGRRRPRARRLPQALPAAHPARPLARQGGPPRRPRARDPARDGEGRRVVPAPLPGEGPAREGDGPLRRERRLRPPESPPAPRDVEGPGRRLGVPLRQEGPRAGHPGVGRPRRRPRPRGAPLPRPPALPKGVLTMDPLWLVPVLGVVALRLVSYWLARPPAEEPPAPESPPERPELKALEGADWVGGAHLTTPEAVEAYLRSRVFTADGQPELHFWLAGLWLPVSEYLNRVHLLTGGPSAGKSLT